MSSPDAPIIVEQNFNSSIKNVWNALTVLDEMTKWYFSNIPTFEPVVGFTTKFIVQVEDRIYAHLWKITEVLPMKKIAYEWKFEGYFGSSISLFELEEEGNQTKLKLTATVIEKFPDNIPEFKRESAIEGWNYLIKESLRDYLAEKKGQINVI